MASGTLSFATAIGAGAIVDSSNTIVIGRPGDTVKVPGIFSPSDLRLKTNIANLNYGLRDLLELRPVTWKWKADANGRTQLGLIAQEVEPIIPELVLHGESKDHLLSMNYIGLLPIVVRAIQEQQATIDELRKQLVLQKPLGSPAISRASLDSAPQKTVVIDGSVTTDERGEAVVVMPAGFESAHGDFRYQLTVVGQFAQAIVAAEIANNRFSIKTDKPNVKVSWQVSARSTRTPQAEPAMAASTLLSKKE